MRCSEEQSWSKCDGVDTSRINLKLLPPTRQAPVPLNISLEEKLSKL